MKSMMVTTIEPVVLDRADFWTGSGYRLPPGSVYIGRGSPYGNPYHIGEHGTRDEVIKRYIEEKSADPDFMAMVRQRLHGKNLVCHCAPRRCHGDWLIIVANHST